MSKKEKYFVDDLQMIFGDSEFLKDVEPELDFERIIQWYENFKVIRDTIGFPQSISDLPQINGPALIVDKSMASTQYFEQLHSIKSFNGTVICCDRALYTLIEHRLPDYVCNLDSSPLCLSFYDRADVKKVMDKITAIFAVTVNPLTVRLWHGKRVFFTPFLGTLRLTKLLMTQSLTPLVTTGGQVASFAWILAHSLGANPIGIFGVTHGYSNPKETEYPMERLKRREGPYGTVWQDNTYQFYNDVFLNYIGVASKEGVVTINTSKAGLLYSSDVKDMSLEEFVKSN